MLILFVKIFDVLNVVKMFFDRTCPDGYQGMSILFLNIGS